MAVIWPNKIRPGSDPFLPSSFKKYDNDNEFEVPKITGQRRFSMASSAETRDQRTVIGENIFIELDREPHRKAALTEKSFGMEDSELDKPSLVSLDEVKIEN
jgi:hypothetical protein